MKRKIIIVIVILAVIVAGTIWFLVLRPGSDLQKECSDGNCELPTEETPIGFIGCSISHNAVDGYYALGGANIWSKIPDNQNYGGGSLSKWYNQLINGVPEGQKDYWKIFRTYLDKYPKPEKIWWQLCSSTKTASLKYEIVLSILNEIKRLAPSAQIYATPTPFGLSGAEDRCGGNGPQISKLIVQRMVQEEKVKLGPTMTPLNQLQVREFNDKGLPDGCHANEKGQAVWGQDLLDFFADCENCENQLQLKQIISEKAVTPGDGGYKRVEALVISDDLFLAYEVAGDGTFELVKLNEDLSYSSSVKNIYAGPKNISPHDIRLATDGTNLWYAFESVTRSRDTCSGHYLNIVKYDDGLTNPPIYNLNVNEVSGCGTSPENYQNPIGEIPENPEAIDDPAPIYYKEEYIVMTRAWLGSSVQHVRKFNNNLELIDHFLLDLGNLSEMNGRILSQFSLVNIEGDVYIIGSLINDTAPGSDAGVYAIHLSNNLKSVIEIIPLINYSGRVTKKVNRAIYDKGKLYVNYAEKISGEAYHHLGIYDVNNDFAKIQEIQFQDRSISRNHASIEVFNNQVYVFYNEDEAPGNFDILGQVFEW